MKDHQEEQRETAGQNIVYAAVFKGLAKSCYTIKYPGWPQSIRYLSIQPSQDQSESFHAISNK